jgi:glycosyltransferase involved in cell wall biosynthesis
MVRPVNGPLVSVLTPVYNGEQYLAECIESVLDQHYEHWEYHIVNNCSTDGTLAIAESYAKKDSRIRVKTNNRFVGVIENHNIAFRLVSRESRYCKIVCADDSILPQCLATMVQFAEEHPKVGVVGAYQRSGNRVRWRELSPAISVLPGREACRLALLEGRQIFGAPTAFLYRADVVRSREPFFPHLRPHADTSVCYELLQHCDFGVIHEILTEERVHDQQITSKIEKLGAGTLAYLEVFHEYGPRYLSRDEFEVRKIQVMNNYYRYLGRCVFKLRSKEFWAYQASRLREMELALDFGKIARFALVEAMTEIRNPAGACEKLVGLLRGRSG